jgi:hypothetical protein
MEPRITYAEPRERAAEKERSRRADERAVAGGALTPARLKRENEAFAFPQHRVQLLLGSARSLH